MSVTPRSPLTPRTAAGVKAPAVPARKAPATSGPKAPVVRRPASFQAAPAGDDDYVAFCEKVRRICAVDLLQYKRAQMERRIRTWCERRGTPELAAYAGIIAKDAAERDAFLDRVTINVSQLWRHPEQWDSLSKHILPELAAKGRVRAWSAGCSYGAEAYTLAAVCRSVVPGVRTEIRGTDLDRRMVARAREGVFTGDDARLAPKALLSRFFDDQGAGAYRAKPELRSMMRFEEGDLLRLPVRREAHDLVMCRNTVIYFNDEARDALHDRLVASLRPGGYLIVGTSERVSDPGSLGLESPFHFIYRKS
jgi:chemotaxis protein methyltransferase CheR